LEDEWKIEMRKTWEVGGGGKWCERRENGFKLVKIWEQAVEALSIY